MQGWEEGAGTKILKPKPFVVAMVAGLCIWYSRKTAININIQARQTLAAASVPRCEGPSWYNFCVFI